MDSKRVEQLLARYWQCETSVEEEAELRRFFCEDDVPEQLLRYKPLFQYQQLQQEERLGSDFDSRVLAAIEDLEEVPHVKARRVTLATRLIPFFKAAAVVALALLLGDVARHTFLTDDVHQEVAVAVDTIGKQISAPSVARSEDAAATREKPVLDSLSQVDTGQEVRD